MNKELQCCDNPNHKKLYNIYHKIFGETVLKECLNCNTGTGASGHNLDMSQYVY